MKATELLTRQHQQTERLLRVIKSAPADIESLLTRLADEQAAHMAIEEQIFFPAVRALDRGRLFTSGEEHAVAAIELARMVAGPADALFSARLTILGSLLANHRERAESFFPKVEEAYSTDQLEKLGAEMLALYEETALLGFERALNRIGRSRYFEPKSVAPALEL